MSLSRSSEASSGRLVLWQVGNGKNGLSSAVKLSKLISSPRLSLRIMILQVTDGPFSVISFFDVSLVSLVHIVVEWVLKGNRVNLIGSLDAHSESSNDGLVGSPRIRDKSSGIEQSRSDYVGLEVLLNSSFLNGPSNNFQIIVRFIPEFNLVKSVVTPVVALGDIAAVEVEVCVVMVTEVVGGIDIASTHKQKLYVVNKHILFQLLDIAFSDNKNFQAIYKIKDFQMRKQWNFQCSSPRQSFFDALIFKKVFIDQQSQESIISYNKSYLLNLVKDQSQYQMYFMLLVKFISICCHFRFIHMNQHQLSISLPKDSLKTIKQSEAFRKIESLSNLQMIFTYKASFLLILKCNYYFFISNKFDASIMNSDDNKSWLNVVEYLELYLTVAVYSKQQQMKTSQSFFPTRTNLKSREGRQERAFQLIKKHESTPDDNEDDDDFNINIFRDAHNPPVSNTFDQQNQRPVGGLDLFRKMEQAGRDRLNQNRRHSKRSNKESTQRNISSNFNNNRFRKEKGDADDRQNQDAVFNRPISQIAHPLRSSLPEETFKSHITYMPHSSSVKSHSIMKFTNKTEGFSRPSTSKPSSFKTKTSHDQWASVQRKQYQDKAALLNEINYNRPLVQTYGNRYFEYILRNRFQEDLKPPAYIYQIGKKFSQSRVIEKIKKYRPDIKQKGMMMLKGKKLGFDDS